MPTKKTILLKFLWIREISSGFESFYFFFIFFFKLILFGKQMGATWFIAVKHPHLFPYCLDLYRYRYYMCIEFNWELELLGYQNRRFLQQ